MLPKIGNLFDYYAESKFTLIIVWQTHSWYLLKGKCGHTYLKSAL